MKTPVTDLFRDEVMRFRLRYACEDCAYWDVSGSRCSHEYPSEAHERRSLDSTPALFFCKEFELV